MVISMSDEQDLAPSLAGVVYSPGGLGWKFFPEERLFVGLTGTEADRTNVRSVLAFDLPGRDKDVFLLRASLRLHLVRNEPPGWPKLICVRETPHGPGIPWTLQEELAQPVPAEHNLSSEIGLDLEFDLTGLAEAWMRGAPNNGILLNFGSTDLGLVAFGNGLPGEPGPVLRLVQARPAKGTSVKSEEIEPDSTWDSPPIPCGEAAVLNLGPGLVWVTPLYRQKGDPPVDPAGIPLGIVGAGEHLVIHPRLRAEAMAIRITTSIDRALVVVIPLAVPAGREEA